MTDFAVPATGSLCCEHVRREGPELLGDLDFFGGWMYRLDIIFTVIMMSC